MCCGANVQSIEQSNANKKTARRLLSNDARSVGDDFNNRD
jgi:hypothetical protein